MECREGDGSQLPVTFAKSVCSWEHMGVHVCTQLMHLPRGESDSHGAEKGHKEDEDGGFSSP